MISWFSVLLSDTYQPRVEITHEKQICLNAANFVTASTIDEYQRYVDAAKYSNKDEMQKLSFLSRFQALIIRHRIPAIFLEKMNGKEAFIYAVDNDWIGKTTVITMTVKNFQISGSRAVSDAYVNGKKSPYRFTYKKENGEWKFDLTQILMNSELAFKAATKHAKMKENDFIFMVLEATSGTKPSQDTWIPQFKK